MQSAYFDLEKYSSQIIPVPIRENKQNGIETSWENIFYIIIEW